MLTCDICKATSEEKTIESRWYMYSKANEICTDCVKQYEEYCKRINKVANDFVKKKLVEWFSKRGV